MSLPPATKDVSNKPAAGLVVDPVNKTAKDADVDRQVCTRFIRYGTELGHRVGESNRVGFLV